MNFAAAMFVTVLPSPHSRLPVQSKQGVSVHFLKPWDTTFRDMQPEDNFEVQSVLGKVESLSRATRSIKQEKKKKKKEFLYGPSVFETVRMLTMLYLSLLGMCRASTVRDTPGIQYACYTVKGVS
jgi:hypothetical protein